MPLERSQRPTVAGAPSCGTANEPTGIWRVLGDRLQRRSDSEHEQVLIRIGFAVAILFYLGVVALGEQPPPTVGVCLLMAAWYLAGAIALFAHLVWRPETNPPRRFTAMLLDLGTLPFGMIIGGELVAPLYPLFLWNSLGMGFRYGRTYLFCAAALSLIGFAAVIALSDFWRTKPALAAGLWIALLAVPVYASSLLSKLNQTRAAKENQPLWRRLVAQLRQRLDSEHEQILIRLVIATAALLYLMLTSLGAGELGELAERCVALGVAYLLSSLALLAHLLLYSTPHPARRYAGMCLDMVTLTLVLVWGEAVGALFYPFYLWVTLGMGFRYGRRYLFVSAGLSLVSFAIVIALTEYWQAQPALTTSLWAALFALPAYTSTLLTKLTDAVGKAEAASRAKSRFLATMSHELRTPLHAILGMSDLLRATRLNVEQQDMVRTVRSAGQTLLDMIDDVLDIAKIESRGSDVQLLEFDLHEVLATVRTILHHQAIRKGLSLRLDLDAGAPYRLLGAGRSLRQVLVNLVANAIKFTDHGGITVKLVATSVGLEQVALRIEVQDTGIGISADVQEHIFDRFTQGDESNTRSYGGAGLGLAIARQLTSLMGGTLEVESAPGSGACFIFKAPFGKPPNEGSRRLRGRVVVIGAARDTDDYCRRLSAWGAEVTPVDTVLEAMDVLARSGRERAILLVEGPGTGSHGSPGSMLARRFPAEPLNLVIIGDGPGAAETLAVLPPDVDDAQLHVALHAALASPQVPDERSETLTGGRISRRILVAEDNRINQKVIEKMLRWGGHVVTIVENGEQALDALREQDFDLVLLDLNMPVMGGVDVVKLHRFATGARDDPPFVALTADATEESRRLCMDAGIDAYLTKPVDTGELLTLIDRLTAPMAAMASGLGAVVVHHPRLAGGGPPVLDWTHLERLRQLDDGDDFLAEVIQDFIADGEELVMELEAAAAACDAAAFRDNAHALRSSVAHIGATALFEICLGWRGLDPAELAEHGASYVTQLKSEFERLRSALLALKVTSSDEPPALGESR